MGEKEGVIRNEQKGIKSEAYLERYKGSALLSKTRIRTDEYRPVQGIIVRENIEK